MEADGKTLQLETMELVETVELAFSIEEYEQRLSTLRAHMAERRVDVLIVDQVEHLGYLTGYVPTAAMYQACLIPLDGDPVMILRALDEPMFIEQSWLRNYVRFSDWDDPIAVLVKTASERGWSRARIGLETDSHFLLPKRYEAIKAGLPEAEFVDFSTVLWEMRLRKSPQEIEYLRQAAHIADQALLSAVETMAPGVSERELAAAISRTSFMLGADNTRMALLTSGPRSATLHGALGHRILEEGDVVHIETIPHVRGYTARTMRPTVLGEPSDEQKSVSATLLRIQDEQIAAMIPGAPANEVDRICREQVLAAGLRDEYPNATAYTLGFVAIPRTSDFTRVFLPNADWELESGMVFHVYTGAHGLSFSETVLVTDEGPERLTKLERKLYVRR